MKRNLLMVALTMCICMSLAAKKLPTTFFSVTLGQTSLEQAAPLLEKQGFERSQFSDDEFMLFSPKYNGEAWDLVIMKFYDSVANPNQKVLDTVEFYKREYVEMQEVGEGEDRQDEYVDEKKANAQIAAIDLFGKNTLSKLKRLYGMYFKSTGDLKVFDDGATNIWFYVGPSAGMPGVMPYDVQMIYTLSTNR